MAAVLFLVFGLCAYMLPLIMLALNDISPVAAVLAVAVFLLAPFLVFWLRGRAQARRSGAPHKD